MKKGKFFLPLFLSVLLICGLVPLQSLAEDTGEEYVDDAYSEETEPETEHLAAYYDEIQSNNIPNWPQGDPVNAETAILMDADTGAILYAKSIEKQEYPASITKIMTTLIALEKGNLSDVVTFSENAVYSIEYGSSHLGLTAGEELTLEQCLYGIMLASANEISNAVAEHIGGDIETFVGMMNEKAQELGCTNTHFVNVHGLHDENHYVCAKDMALIMQAALKNEKFREIIGTVEYNFPETNLVDEVRYFINHHKMISEEGMLYDGCIGGKNGYTDEAWNTLVTAAERDGMTIISVVLRCPGQYVSYDDTKVLLDYGFANFHDAQIANTNSADIEITGIEDAAELEKIKQADFSAAPFEMAAETKVTLPAGVEASALKKTMDFGIRTLSYSYEGQILGSVPFTYTGEWETEAPTEVQTEAVTETEAAESSGGVGGAVSGILGTIAGGALMLYSGMDTFIEENTVIACIIGAVLLLIFVPLLLVSINRKRKYMKMMELREEELKLRRQLEEEIERKSAAQVEAELREAQLRQELEEEKEKRRRQEKELEELESISDFYLDEESDEEMSQKLPTTKNRRRGRKLPAEKTGRCGRMAQVRCRRRQPESRSRRMNILRFRLRRMKILWIS